MRASKSLGLFLALKVLVFLNMGADQSFASIELVSEGSFEHDCRVGYYEDTVCEITCPPGCWRHHYVVWHEGGADTGIDEVRWNTGNLQDCAVYIKSHAWPPFGHITVYYKVWRIREDVDWMREGTWLLVYGRAGNANNWNVVKGVLESSPYNVPSNNIYVVDGIQTTTLYDWTNRLVNWMDSQGMLSFPDGSVKAIAHSFGCAVTLYLLRATYELQYGNVSTLASQVRDHCNYSFHPGNNLNKCLEIANGLVTLGGNPTIAAKWINAVKKIQGVYLYHPAIRGGCGACFAGAFGDDNAASICALGTVDDELWYPISRPTWYGCKKVVNIYGFGGNNVDCDGACVQYGIESHDGALQDDDQRLLPGGDGNTGTGVEGSYTELFGGRHCHGDFKNNTNNATEDLVLTIVNNPTPCPYDIPLWGSVYNGYGDSGYGGPLTDRCPSYLIVDDVIVPSGRKLTIHSGAKIRFLPGKKIIAHGMLEANEVTLDKSIYLISEDTPHCGMRLKNGYMVLGNGGEFRPGLAGKISIRRFNLHDFARFAASWLEKNCSSRNNWCGGADLDEDSVVDFSDLFLWMNEFYLDEYGMPRESK